MRQPSSLLTLGLALLYANAVAAQSKVGDYAITPQTSVIAIVMIVVGFFFCFFGHRFFKTVIFLAGFVAVGFLAYVTCYKISDPNTGTKSTIYLVVAVVAGILGGCLFMCVWKLGIAAIGALGGFALGMFILSLGDGMLIAGSTGRVMFIIALIVVGIVGIFFFEKHVVIVGTAMAGAYMLIVGIDYFIGTGFTQHLVAFLNGAGQVFYHTNGRVYAMLASMAVLAVIGAVVQYRSFRQWSRK
ncbi:hypothetical protein K493DRAFT_315623 [Basidiobolus meristosporus CBS 931.73]|uniref:Transmembrane protein 198 n=1 Tax=Basidiobolus meristosporus CBS 931.73 TaxID=1314790 RepID=A0A1Y1Y9B3_9FUNG|nr:hypothetical protein K493DRAFT_315623 [Basidiobolus meristosporus CBS 931.73]|eukprot:ORX94154.1 hypothetical protein K493DRAFT_315623 [Basidiobolus meristosporus CBS 931.73]